MAAPSRSRAGRAKARPSGYGYPSDDPAEIYRRTKLERPSASRATSNSPQGETKRQSPSDSIATALAGAGSKGLSGAQGPGPGRLTAERVGSSYALILNSRAERRRATSVGGTSQGSAHRAEASLARRERSKLQGSSPAPARAAATLAA